MSGALFEDRHTDAAMRRTIPQFAVLGALAVGLTAWWGADTPAGRLIVVGIAALALASAWLTTRRDIIDRLPEDAVLALLLGYCVLISLAVAASGDPNSPYRLLFMLPVTYSAVFFRGWVRYAMAVIAPLADYVIVGFFLEASGRAVALRVVMFMLVAHFGAVVSETLREALRAHRSLHTVLEAASGAPLEADLAEIGLDAALSVVDWDAGAVLLLEDELFTVGASRGFSPEAGPRYEAMARDASSTLAGQVMAGDEVVYVRDVRDAYPAGHLLVDEGMRSMAVLPIRFQGEGIGVLVVLHRSLRAIGAREEDRLQRVAEQLGLALGSAAAYRRETQVSERLRELNRRKDAFLANISHELRTPAATIKLVASTLHLSGDRLEPEQRNEMYGTLERRAAHLTELIENLLDEALADAGSTRLSIGPIEWRSSILRWAELAELNTGRRVTVELPDSVVTAAGDAVKLERVVSNLLSNAAKFSPPDTPIVLALSTTDDGVRIDVSDRGVGIPEPEFDRIFDRFHQVDAGLTRSAGGFGIGLSLTRHFVEAHGGTVTVESRLGEGSTFTVRIPRTPRPNAITLSQSRPASQPAPPPSAPHPAVLE